MEKSHRILQYFKKDFIFTIYCLLFIYNDDDDDDDVAKIYICYLNNHLKLSRYK